MKKIPKLILSIILSLLAAACSSSPAVNTEKFSDVDFNKFDSYAYLPGENTTSGDTTNTDTTGYSTFPEQKVIEEVNQQMEARGYELDTAAPDLLVLVKTMLEEEERYRREPLRTNYNYTTPGAQNGSALGPIYYRNLPAMSRMSAFSETVREVEYTEGTFVVDVIDRSNNKIIWRGWSATPVDEQRLDSSIRDYIANIFEEYPADPVTEQ